MHVALVGQPCIQLAPLLVVANEIWGFSLAEGADRIGSITDVERGLLCMASLQAGSPQKTVPKHLLSLVDLSWLLVADERTLMSSLNYLPQARRLIVPTSRPPMTACWLQATLLEVLTAISLMASYPLLDQTLYQRMRTELEHHGLSNFVHAHSPLRLK